MSDDNAFPATEFFFAEDIIALDGVKISVTDGQVQMFSRSGNFLGRGLSLEEATRSALDKIKKEGDNL